MGSMTGSRTQGGDCEEMNRRYYIKPAVRAMLVLTVILLLPILTYAKAYFAPVDEMIRDADAIAVIKILDTQPAKTEEQDLRYKDMVAAIVVKEAIKGDLSNVTSIYIPNFFPCAVVDVTPGEYLVFLRRRDGVMTNANWHLSLRAIHGDVVSWFSENKKDFSDVPLTDIKQQIEKQLGTPHVNRYE